MCAQVMCEVPDDCVFNGASGAGDCCAEEVTQGNCNTYCPPQCDPCQAPPEYPPCPPGGDCNYRCDCGDLSGCCYQQPPRTQPVRPTNNIYGSRAPIETDTIYKRSFYANCGDCYRAKPVLPCNHLRSSMAPIDKCTIQKLSYMPPCQAARTAPIRPRNNNLEFRGPMFWMTSQKHDFVPKGYCKRGPIQPVNGICKPCAPLERCTINKLSYMPYDVCQNPPPKPLVQGAHIMRASGPSEQCTVQKLSYLPVCIPPKQPMPWAEKVRCPPPRYENLCTTYHLSYIPNCNTYRTAPIMPVSGLKCFGTDSGDRNTVYKLSYMPVDGRCCRPSPILPVGGLHMPTGPMEKCTVQKLSYQPNCCSIRTLPIRPRENCVKPCGPLYAMTTQKHDFVPKPICRRAPIKNPDWICRASGPIDSCTINKLSYMPVNVCDNRRPAPILQPPGIDRMVGPIDKCTTYKLSYLPNCVGPKEPLPWARVASYVRPTAPIEKCTIQKLSYGPPGTFSRCGDCCPKNPCPSYPKAAICL